MGVKTDIEAERMISVLFHQIVDLFYRCLLSDDHFNPPSNIEGGTSMLPTIGRALNIQRSTQCCPGCCPHPQIMVNKLITSLDQIDFLLTKTHL